MNKPKKKKQLHKYLHLTGVTFQMGITIYLGVFIGKWLDDYLQTSRKTYVIIGTLLSLIVAIWAVVLQLKKINENYE